MTVRKMVPADGPWVARLLALSFEEGLHPYLPYCQEGVSRYLEIVLRHRLAFADRTLLVALEGHEPAGFAEFRRSGPDCDILSYICTEPKLRRRGIARELLRHRLAAGSAPSRLELDVFAHNNPALQLYEKLGFAVVRSTAWWHRDVPEPAEAPLVFVDLHAAIASLEQYGFCQLPTEHEGELLALGLTSRSVVRVPRSEFLDDERLLGGLRQLLPDVRVAVAMGVAAGTAAAGDILLRSQRYLADASILRSRL